MAKESLMSSVGETGFTLSNKVVDVATRVTPFLDEQSFWQGVAATVFVAVVASVVVTTPMFDGLRKRERSEIDVTNKSPKG